MEQKMIKNDMELKRARKRPGMELMIAARMRHPARPMCEACSS